ncbi:hypothetical protein PI124_g14122 [Phytophthora idaei]|nr:hypothetical protein PI125_g15338 [Phytophthora idaei]KAG3143935.1 hypothetical protein PI126_g14397 [Phytophthora idaei]KAG3241005.1 hypothetical protein PI124_g14122 [Phytophthora idaei]
MDIADFVCYAAEANTEMEMLTPEELLGETTDMTFLETATEDPPLEADDSIEEESYTVTTKQGVDAICGVLFMLTDHPDLEKKLARDLRLLQSRAREQLRLETEEALTQTTITSFSTATTRP